MQPETANRGVLSIAGYDPCGGAGVLADIKTFEQIGSCGCGVITALTYQNDIEFKGLKWLSNEEVKRQFDALINRFEFHYVKIGLLQSVEMLQFCIELLKNNNPEIKIIWDPVMNASAGFDFGNGFYFNVIKPFLKDIHLITPNTNEVVKLFPNTNAEEAAAELSMYCNVLLKGGHKDGSQAVDVLYQKKKATGFVSEKIKGQEKRGTGCVLSSAITAYLDAGDTLEIACNKAKKYTLHYIKSTDNHLGFHSKHASILV